MQDITLLTCNFNTSDMTLKMLSSFFTFNKIDIPVVIFDNSDREPLSEICRKLFTVIDNRNYRITKEHNQCSKNHAATIDYALKNVIKTKYCLLCDTDVEFKNDFNKFLELRYDYDYIGHIAYDEFIKPDRIHPCCCIINVEKFNQENRNYYDPNRCIIPNFKTLAVNYVKYDTGASFYEDIQNSSWKIKVVPVIKNYFVHYGFGSHQEDNIASTLGDIFITPKFDKSFFNLSNFETEREEYINYINNRFK